VVLLTLLSLTSVLIHGQCILWVSGKQRTLWKRIYLASNLFHEMPSLWLCINMYPHTLFYLGQCLSENYWGGKKSCCSLNLGLMIIESKLYWSQKHVEL